MIGPEPEDRRRGPAVDDVLADQLRQIGVELQGRRPAATREERPGTGGDAGQGGRQGQDGHQGDERPERHGSPLPFHQVIQQHNQRCDDRQQVPPDPGALPASRTLTQVFERAPGWHRGFVLHQIHGMRVKGRRLTGSPHPGERSERGEQRRRIRGGAVLHPWSQGLPRASPGFARSPLPRLPQETTHQHQAAGSQDDPQRHRGELPGGVRPLPSGRGRAIGHMHYTRGDQPSRTEHQRREQPNGHTSAGEHQGRYHHARPGFPRHEVAPGEGSWLPEKQHPIQLAEARQSQAADQSQPHGPHHRETDARVRFRRAEEPAKHDPLTDEAVERWQAHDRHRPHPERHRGQRHPAAQTPQLIDHPRPRGVHHRPRAQKQEALEQCMVERVQHRPHEAQHRHHRPPIGQPQHAHPHAQQDDPDILHAMIGEQPLEIVLAQRP